MESTSGDTRTRRGLSRPALFVLAILLVAAGTAGVAVNHVVTRQESTLLEERTTDIELVLNSAFSSVTSSLTSLGAVGVATNYSNEQFVREATPLAAASEGTSIALLQKDQQGVKIRAAVGPDLKVDTNLSGVRYDAINAASRGPNQLVATPVFQQGDQKRIGFAVGTPAGAVLYREAAVKPFDPRGVTRNTAFNEVKVALYATPTPDTDQLVIATTDKLPLGKSATQRHLPINNGQWSMNVEARHPLVGGITKNLGWMVFGVAVIVSFLVTLVVEILGRRRDYALAMVDSRDQQTALILDAAKDAFISINIAGDIVQWNRQAVELFGWSTEEAVGKPLAETIVPFEMRDAHTHGLANFAATGEGPLLNTRLEVEAVHRTGRRFPVELAIWPVKTESGYFFHAFLHDITDRRTAAEDMERAHAQALEASRLKSEFLANMSHEIRTPMNGVIGMTGLLLRTELDMEQREYAETVRASSEALLAVINDILDFSKIEAGRLELEHRDFDVRSVVEEVADLLADLAHTKDLELATSVDHDVPVAVCGDAGRLRQVLLNLAGNAVKFTEVGEVVIRTSVEEVREKSVRLRFRVSDTGVGISAQDQARIFGSFTQVDASSTRRHEGTGLGLSIARQLAELMHGTLDVTSEPGKGSTFSFTAEFTNGDADAIAATPSLVPLDGIRVLIVDDNETNRKILCTHVTDWGMNAVSANGAAEALAALRSAANDGNPFALVLLDFQMPETNGVQLAEQIRAHSSLDETRIIVLTSAGVRVGRVGLQRLGVSSCLSKPVHQMLLRNRIVDALELYAPSRSGVSRTVRDFSGARVLVAEDNPVNQLVAKRMLEKLGCVVEIAGNGVEAVAAAKRAVFDIVLIDCQMPEMDGYEATATIRTLEGGTRHMPVIAMTASAMKGDRERALQSGMDDYLPKPVQLAELASMLQKWCRPTESRPTRSSIKASGPPSDQVLDLNAVDLIRSSMESDSDDVFRSLVVQFGENARQHIATINDALSHATNDLPAEDRALVARSSHTLRGGSATIGARQLSALCMSLEEATMNGDLQTIRDIAAAITAAATTTLEALTAVTTD